MNQLARFVAQLTTPLLPYDYLTLVDPLLATTGYRSRIHSIRRETVGSRTFEFEMPKNFPAHTAGQFLRLGVDIAAVRHWRSYSITSPECSVNRRVLSITVKQTSNGLVSGHLVNDAQVGDLVFLEPAAGDFVLPPAPSHDLIFLAFGSGITPIASIVRTLAARGGTTHRVLLVMGARTESDVIFGDEFTALAGSVSWLDVVLWPSATKGRFELEKLEVIAPNWMSAHTYVSGPAAILDRAEQLWESRALTELLHTERFVTALAHTAGGGGEVTFSRTNRTSVVDGQTTLLAAGEAAGVLMPSGCRMGICHTCVVPLKSGQVRDMRTGEIHGEPGEIIQTCISSAACDVELNV
jgi:ferredoxin-NADP reductase